MSVWIKFFYGAMPICMIMQTLATLYMALVLNKISKRRRSRHDR